MESAHLTIHRWPEAPGLELMEVDDARGGVAPHFHQGALLILIEQGCRRWWVGGEPIDLAPGDLLFLKPGAPHAVEPAGEDRVSYRAVRFQSEQLGLRLADRPALFCSGWRAGFDSGCGAALSRFIDNWIRNGPGEDWEERLLAFVSGLTQRGVAVGRRSDSPAAQRIARRLSPELMRASKGSRTLTALARVAALSPWYCNRQFARGAGLPPHAFGLQQRLALARELLRQGHSPAEAARAAGFFDQSHLHRAFRKYVGMTPGAFLRTGKRKRPSD